MAQCVASKAIAGFHSSELATKFSQLAGSAERLQSRLATRLSPR